MKVVIHVSAIKKDTAVRRIKDSKAVSDAPLPLVPPLLLIPLWLVSLVLPNLVYSGMSWYDTLHIVKWAVACIPVGIAVLVAGARLAVYGRERIDMRIDLFGVLWMALLAYATAQAAWVDISSRTGFVHELLCFAAVWAFYVISWSSFPDRAIRPLLWLANVSAAVNVVFAELQIRSLNEFQIFGFDGFKRIILPTPGNYIGNTGQQNMFGLWMAVCVMSSIYLYIAYATTHSGKKRHPAVTALNLALMLVNMWGLLNSTSRSAMLSLFAGLAVIVVITLCRFDKDYVKRLTHVGALFTLVFVLSLAVNHDRAAEMIMKLADMLKNPETIGGRSGIWATSLTMFKMYAFSGVGIGQYKWHYLEAQREAFNFYPDLKWQYTHWAHNEFIQWFCEGGVIGGLLLMAMWAVWGVFLVKMLLRRERVAREVIWGCALVALVSFNALWTRPFHRVENILWLSLAFAVANRGMLSVPAPGKSFALERLTRPFGAMFCAAALSGLYYLGGGMAADRLLREAHNSGNTAVQHNLLERAAGHLMVREEAVKQLGYHYMRIGEAPEQWGNNERIMVHSLLEREFMSISADLHGMSVSDYVASLSDDIKALKVLDMGFGNVWGHFLREPHSEDISLLLDWSQRFQNLPILETVVSYLKPGSYRLEEQQVQDHAGNPVNAVIFVPQRSFEASVSGDE